MSIADVRHIYIESFGVTTEGGLSLWYKVLMSYITAVSCKEVEGTSYVGGAGPMTRLMESGHLESKSQNRKVTEAQLRC